MRPGAEDIHQSFRGDAQLRHLKVSACKARLAESYGVPEGAPATTHENASGDEAVRSMAGSTVE